MFVYGPVWEAWISDLHIVGMIQSLEMTAAQHNRLPLISLPCGLKCILNWRFSPQPAQLFLISDFAASVRDCLTPPSQTTAAITVCSGLSQTQPPTKMISQVNPSTEGNTVSSCLLEIKAVLKSRSLLILYCSVVACTHWGKKSIHTENVFS